MLFGVAAQHDELEPHVDVANLPHPGQFHGKPLWPSGHEMAFVRASGTARVVAASSRIERKHHRRHSKAMVQNRTKRAVRVALRRQCLTVGAD